MTNGQSAAATHNRPLRAGAARAAPTRRPPPEPAVPYMLLIIEPPGQRQERGREAGEAAYARMLQYGDALRARGLLLDSQSLAGTEAGARLQVREGRRRVVDGPFAEAKEMVGGYFLVDCATRDEALALAAECPAAAWASTEVRALAPCFEDG